MQVDIEVLGLWDAEPLDVRVAEEGDQCPARAARLTYRYGLSQPALLTCQVATRRGIRPGCHRPLRAACGSKLYTRDVRL